MSYRMEPTAPATISVYSPALEPLGIVEQYTALHVLIQFFSVGRFEVTLPGTPRLYDLLQKDRVLDFGQGGAIAGLIEGVKLSLTAQGVTMQVYGPLLNGLMRRRLAVPSADPDLYGWDVASGPAGSIMAHYVQTHCIAPEQPSRALPLLALAAGIDQVGMETVAKARFQPLSEVLFGVAQYASVGWRIVIAEDHYEFQALAPVDRTRDSDRPLILATAFGNVATADASSDAGDYANAVYALGEGEYENRLYQVYFAGDAPVTGWARSETVADCGNEASIARLREVALQKIADLEQTDTITLQGIAGQTDANVGDLVTLDLPEIGAHYDLLITEMAVNIQGATTGMTLTLGKPPRTLTGQLQRAQRLRNIT